MISIREKLTWFLILTILPSHGLEQQQQQQQQQQAQTGKKMRVLALFSGTSNDLGLDHRLGRQVLKLAAQKAQQLNPQLDGIELIVHNDDTDCNSLNEIPNRLVEQFYLDQARWNECDRSKQEQQVQQSAARGSCDANLDVENDELDRYIGSGNNASQMTASGLGSNRTEKQVVVAQRHDQRIHAIIGPSCDPLVDLVARMAAYWSTPIYSVTSIDGSFGRKDVYPTLTRLSPSIDQMSMFVVKTIHRFKWLHLAILADRRQLEESILLDNLERTINRLHFAIPIERKLFDFDTLSDFAAKPSNQTSLAADRSVGTGGRGSLCSKQARETLLAAKQVARVYLLLFNNHLLVRRLLLCAHELQMNNGEFTFLAVDLGLKSAEAQVASVASAQAAAAAASDGPTSGGRTAESAASMRAAQTYDWYSASDEQNNAIARQMFESLLVFSVEQPISDEHSFFVEQTLDLAQQQYPNFRFERSSVGPVAIALHDSLLLAAAAFTARNQSLVSQSAVGVGEQLMWGQQYPYGLVAGGMRINRNGDQELDYVLNDLEPEMGVMRPVASYSREDGGRVRLVPDTYIHWPARAGSSRGQQQQQQDEPPADEPECGFTGEAEQCVDRQNLYAALSVVLSLATLVLASAAYSLLKYRRIKYEMQLDDYWWKVDWSELQFIQATDSLVSSRPQSLARALRSGGSVISGSGAGSLVSARFVPKPTGASAREAAASSQQKNQKQEAGARQVPKIITSAECDPIDAKSEAAGSGHSQHTTVTRLVAGSALQSASGQQSFANFVSEYSSVVRSASLAMYKNELVIVKQLNSNSIEVSRELLVDLRSIREHISDNLCKFVGLCVETSRLAIVYEYCSRGSLRDLLANESLAMDWTLKYSIIGDILNGLNFIHTTQLDYHGRLKSSNLVLDSRFTVKITDFGLQNLYQQLDAVRGEDDDDDDEDDEDGEYLNIAGDDQARDTLSLSVSQRGVGQRIRKVAAGSDHGGATSMSGATSGGSKLQLKNKSSARYFWTAPEHLRDKNPHFAGSKKGDVFSLSIILFELITRREPYYYGTNAKPHWPNIRAERRSHPHRPSTSVVGQHGQLDRLSAGGGRMGPRGSTVSSALGGSMVGARRSSNASGHRHHRGATVHPTQETIVETGSQVSGKSARSRLSALNDDSVSMVADDVQSNAGGGAASENALMDAEDILDQLRMGVQPEPVRPYLPNHVLRQQDVNPKLVELMRLCWSESHQQRPTLSQVRNTMRRITKGMASKNYLDNLLERLQTYAAELERIVDERSGDIVAEKFRTEELLYQLVPKFVADRLKTNQPIVPQVFDGVTIFFSDIVGFDNYASVMSPSDLVNLLNTIYSSFDSIISSFDVTKIETIIDQFLVASGISLQQEQDMAQPVATQAPVEQPAVAAEPQTQQQKQEHKKRALLAALRIGGREPSAAQANVSTEQAPPGEQSAANQAAAYQAANSNSSGIDRASYRRSSAEQIARMALCIRDLVKSAHFRQSLCSRPAAAGEQAAGPNPVASHFNIRIGIHSGKVCAGIVGVKRPKFCLIGDTVNVASRMQTNSKANKIQISVDTKQLLEFVPGFSIEPRGRIEVKGKGMMETYWLESSY